MGWGYESQTTALVRLSPQGELISIDGLQHLGGAHLRTAVQGFSHWQLNQELGLSLAADASVKRAAAAPDLDFASASVQPTLHTSTPLGPVGAGLSLQHMEVAGHPFRDITAVQGNWTLAQAHGDLWSVVAEVGRNRHAPEFADLDASTASVVVQRHWADPVPALQSADVSLYLAREGNLRGLSELSYRAALLSIGVQWQHGSMTLSAATNLQMVAFDDTAFDQGSRRVDRSVGVDLAMQHELTATQALRVEYSAQRSASTLALYDNTYQQVAVKLRSSW